MATRCHQALIEVRIEICSLRKIHCDCETFSGNSFLKIVPREKYELNENEAPVKHEILNPTFYYSPGHLDLFDSGPVDNVFAENGDDPVHDGGPGGLGVLGSRGGGGSSSRGR